MKLYQVDAFAERPFEGNPAAVCLLESIKPDAWLQSVAMEMNLSETAFLLEREDGYSLRWFTPRKEVDLCGHATLASAHILWETGLLNKREEAKFHTRSGMLTARRKGSRIEMDFPAERAVAARAPAALAKALGAKPVYVGKNRFGYLAEFDSESAVRALKPDFEIMKRLPLDRVMVTARSDDRRFDFVSRYFAPGVGVNEDPVTGSAHCCLGPYWSGKLGKNELVGYQASERGGVVGVRVGRASVFLLGKALTVFAGELAPL